MSNDIQISGAECVVALMLARFTVRHRALGHTILERDCKLVIVPDALVLAPAVLDAILADAELTPEAFVELISEEPTMPGVREADLPRRHPG